VLKFLHRDAVAALQKIWASDCFGRRLRPLRGFNSALPEHLGRGIFGPEFSGDHVMAKRDQITVPLPARLREFVERQAQQSDRSMAGVIRHVLAEAARREPEPQEQAA
jgi:hypothetical protein